MEKRKVDLSGRKERAEFVFASVAKLIKDLGGNIHDSEIAANWRAIVGEEYAADLIVKSMSKAGVLTLRAAQSAKITLLAYEVEAVRALVNKWYGREVVKRVVIRK